MFSINHRYSGTEIANIVNPNTINKKKVGGKYATTDYVHESLGYILLNIGTPGRTGHEFDNRYNPKLNTVTWFGKPRSTSLHKNIKKLITKKIKPYIFVRWNNREKYKFVGRGITLGFIDNVPIYLPNNTKSYTIEIKFLIIKGI